MNWTRILPTTWHQKELHIVKNKQQMIKQQQKASKNIIATIQETEQNQVVLKLAYQLAHQIPHIWPNTTFLKF